jgi:hypothetical protein
MNNVTMAVPMLSLVMLSFVTGCTTPRKVEADTEVGRLCAIDGGIKVYETVRLTADKFNEQGGVNFFRPTQKENALGPEYIYRWDQRYLVGSDSAIPNSSDISVRRDHIQIMRQVDGKLLGEVVMYRRSGGDFSGPWVQSSYYCPDPREASEPVLVRLIFTR